MAFPRGLKTHSIFNSKQNLIKLGNSALKLIEFIINIKSQEIWNEMKFSILGVESLTQG
jgi:hypothetical protein